MSLTDIESLLVRDEGEKLFPYYDTATPPRLSLGVGRNLTDRGISQAESRYLLRNDIESHTLELLNALPWVSQLNPARQAVLISMCFNMGLKGLLQFHNTLGLIEQGKYQEAAQAMLQSLWAKQVGHRAERLSQQMATGEWV